MQDKHLASLEEHQSAHCWIKPSQVRHPAGVLTGEAMLSSACCVGFSHPNHHPCNSKSATFTGIYFVNNSRVDYHVDGLWLTGIVRGWGLGCFRCQLHLSISETVLPCFWMVGPKKAAFEKLLGGPRGELLVQLSMAMGTQLTHLELCLPHCGTNQESMFLFQRLQMAGRKNVPAHFDEQWLDTPKKNKSMKTKWVDGVGPQPISEHHGTPHWADILFSSPAAVTTPTQKNPRENIAFFGWEQNCEILRPENHYPKTDLFWWWWKLFPKCSSPPTTCD